MIKFGGMKKWMLVALCLLIVTGAACRSPSGDREYIPGRGWEPVR